MDRGASQPVMAGYSPWSHRVRQDWETSTSLHAIILVVCGLFFFFFFFFFHSRDLMAIFSVIFEFLFLFVCVSITDFWFMITMKFLYRSFMYMYMMALSCWSLNFKCTFLALHLYSPPVMITIFISYFTSEIHVYPLAAYCGCIWFYCFCLLACLLALCVWFPRFTVCLPLLMSFIVS